MRSSTRRNATFASFSTCCSSIVVNTLPRIRTTPSKIVVLTQLPFAGEHEVREQVSPLPGISGVNIWFFEVDEDHVGLLARR